MLAAPTRPAMAELGRMSASGVVFEQSLRATSGSPEGALRDARRATFRCCSRILILSAIIGLTKAEGIGRPALEAMLQFTLREGVSTVAELCTKRRRRGGGGGRHTRATPTRQTAPTDNCKQWQEGNTRGTKEMEGSTDDEDLTHARRGLIRDEPAAIMLPPLATLARRAVAKPAALGLPLTSPAGPAEERPRLWKLRPPLTWPKREHLAPRAARSYSPHVS